jgi:predicted O-linked N-acetylglucosamine transferase (SPINDLY family)
MLGWLRRGKGVEASQRLIARGSALERQGRLPEACRAYRAAVDAAPAHAAAHLNLGVALEELGQPDDAERAYEAARRLEPASAYAAFNLGKLAYTRGQLPRALQLLGEALHHKPDLAEAQVVLASVHEARGDLQAAQLCLEAALRARPGYAGALRNLGLLHARLGNVLFDARRLDEARAHFSRAIDLQPALAEAHAGLGNVLAAEKRVEDATVCYRRALGLDPGLVHAHINLGNMLAARGQVPQARECFEAALALDPESAEARWCRAMTALPSLRLSADELPASRAQFAAQIAALERWFDDERAARGFRVVGLRQPFWLAYQDERNVELLRGYGRLCARLMHAWPARPQPAAPAPRASRRIRVGIVSQYFRQHSVWNALVKGWMTQIDRRHFELLAFCLGGGEDAETRIARENASLFERGPKPLEQWADGIVAARPDVLLYPEIGMDQMCVRLAALRLAPLQATSWGHPETSGLPTVDCFVSAEFLEPEDAPANYTEELVRLPNLGCYVQPETEVPDPRLEGLGLDPGVPLLVCPGTPYKYAPEHDAVFPRIARELGDCRFLFFAYWTRELTEQLQQRIASAFERHGLDAGRYVRVLPWLERRQFLGLLSRADAYLDTIGFSGINTALQAIQCGLPPVTREGRFLRGRFASGILRRIGLHELVAQSEDDYVARAVRLCRDPGYREALRARIAASGRALYEDPLPIRALETFLRRA